MVVALRKANWLIISVAAFSIFVVLKISNWNTNDSSPYLIPHAYFSEWSSFEKDSFHFLTLHGVRKSLEPGHKYAISVHTPKFKQSLDLFEQGCASNAEGNFSSAFISDRVFGLEDVTISEINASGQIISQLRKKVNVIYLEQDPK